MNKLSLLIISLFLSSPAFCSPYFRFAGSESKGPFSGGWDVDAGDISAFSNGEQYGVTDVALITHSTKDGTIIPQSWQKYIAPEDWVPLQIGGGGSFQGSAIINFGSSVNLAPQVFTPLFNALGSSKPWVNQLRSVLTEGYSKNQGLSIAAGPSWYALPVINGTVEPLDKWQGHFGWFTGAAWKF